MTEKGPRKQHLVTPSTCWRNCYLLLRYGTNPTYLTYMASFVQVPNIGTLSANIQVHRPLYERTALENNKL